MEHKTDGYEQQFRNLWQNMKEETHSPEFKCDFAARFVVIWTLLSRIPLPRSLWPKEIPEGHRCLSLAPLAGGLLGVISGFAVMLPYLMGINDLASAWIGAAVYFLIGWALHLDGWGDLWDGIGSGRCGDELREVMKDSRLGSYGGASIVIAFGLWTSLVSSIPPMYRLSACVTSAAAARFAECVAAYVGKYPWEHGMAKGWVDSFTKYDLFTAFVCLAPFLIFSIFHYVLCVFLSALTAVAIAAHMNKRLSGVNGDVMGACAVAAELVSMAVWAM
ncbi:MAG: adenosylcobinamide-GDP ribazoletransferase [Synergistes sp.]|nr:adenosylcobinamide-GDP ribazoletransferase [Synergistes sp.]